MKKTNWLRACASAMILTGTCSYAVQNAQAGVIFEDNFDRPNGTAIGGVWTEAIDPALPLPFLPKDGDILLRDGMLTVPHEAGTFQGDVYPSVFQVGYKISDIGNAWPATLASAAGKMTWTVNMQSSKAQLEGPSSYTSVVLASTSTEPSETKGYAVAWGHDVDADWLRLVHFAPRMQDGFMLPYTTMFINGGAEGEPFDQMGTNYTSVRVEYDPELNTWSLYARDDGSVEFSDPASSAAGDFTLLGTYGLGDDEITPHIHEEMHYVGFAGTYLQGYEDNGYAYRYDNFTISVVPEPSAFLLGSVGLVGIATARRRFHKKAA
jgi:hypothetical protein